MAVPAEPVLIRICDLAGRARGTGFLADDRGTLLTSHEAVDGLSRLVLESGGQRLLVEAAAVTHLPGSDLALVATAGLDATPLVVAVERPAGSRVRIWADGWWEAALGEPVDVTYTATDRFHAVERAVELALPEPLAASLRLNPRASGAPVLDAATGAVVAVLGTALHAPHRDSGFAVPLRRPAAAMEEAEHTVLAALLERNGSTVPGYGPDLNLAGALQLTGASVAAAATAVRAEQRQARAATEAALADFLRQPACVLALVGRPGSGRSTELAAWAARRLGGPAPQPTVWLRGADLRAGDAGVQDAVARALAEAGRIAGRIAAAPAADPGAAQGADPGAPAGPPAGVPAGRPGAAHPDVVARLARDAERPLLVLLDAPEEMPPHLAHSLRRWSAGTASWLQVSGARLAIGCRPEFWEQAGTHFPQALLYAAAEPPVGLPLPPHLPLPDLPSGHPLTLRMLSQLQPVPAGEGPPPRHEVFAGWLALVALRIATSVGAARRPAVRGRALRRLAATAAGRLHLAARRCLGPGQGGLDQRAFEAVFPWTGGWAGAALSLGVLQPAGEGYRFADEEFGDWLQGAHLELGAALDALVHDEPAEGAVPVPRHRIGPVTEALLLAHHTGGPAVLGPWLQELADALGRPGDRGWWAARLLRDTLLRLPDAQPYLPVLKGLAARLLRGGAQPSFGPSFWAALPLPTAGRVDLLRQLLPLDPAPSVPGERHLDAVARLLAERPAAVQPLLCRWFSDNRPLRMPGATVASAAGALLHTHRRQATDELTDALVAALTTVGGAAARELLAELVQDEPAALSRAVRRWAADPRTERRTAAARYLPALAGREAADRPELALAARELLRLPDDSGSLHPAAYGYLVADVDSRGSYLSAALLRFAREPGDRPLTRALAHAMHTHPRQVLAAFRHRLCGPQAPTPGTAVLLLDALGELRVPALARQVAALVGEFARQRPELAAAPLAHFTERRLAAGSAARATLRPLLTELLTLPCAELRSALAGCLGRAAAHSALARELLPAPEEEAGALDTLLRAVGEEADPCHRVGRQPARTGDVAARPAPEFAGLGARRAAEAPAADDR